MVTDTQLEAVVKSIDPFRLFETISRTGDTLTVDPVVPPDIREKVALRVDTPDGKITIDEQFQTSEDDVLTFDLPTAGELGLSDPDVNLIVDLGQDAIFKTTLPTDPDMVQTITVDALQSGEVSTQELFEAKDSGNITDAARDLVARLREPLDVFDTADVQAIFAGADLPAGSDAAKDVGVPVVVDTDANEQTLNPGSGGTPAMAGLPGGLALVGVAVLAGLAVLGGD